MYINQSHQEYDVKGRDMMNIYLPKYANKYISRP